MTTEEDQMLDAVTEGATPAVPADAAETTAVTPQQEPEQEPQTIEDPKDEVD